MFLGEDTGGPGQGNVPAITSRQSKLTGLLHSLDILLCWLISNLCVATGFPVSADP